MLGEPNMLGECFICYTYAYKYINNKIVAESRFTHIHYYIWKRHDRKMLCHCNQRDNTYYWYNTNEGYLCSIYISFWIILSLCNKLKIFCQWKNLISSKIYVTVIDKPMSLPFSSMHDCTIYIYPSLFEKCKSPLERLIS